MKKIMKIFVLLFFAITYSLPTSAKLYMGKITMQVGETRSVEAVPPISAYTASGYFSKSGSGFWISASSSYTCKITATYVGTGTLSYWGSVARANTWTTEIYDLYWDVEVKSASTKVTSVSLNSSSISLQVGETKQLSATVSPSNATDKSVSWSSGSTSIATVSSSGLVTAKSAGSATITCKANDGSGKYATCYVTVTNPDVTVAEINATNFPDDSFRSWLLSQTYGADGKLTESEISSITSINISGSYSSPGTIKSLKGIEYFTALKYLHCSYNQLTTLDVSKLTALTDLYCYDNQLTALDVSNLTALTDLSCGNNQLTALDVSRLTALTYLSCGNNQLTALDVSRLTALKSLYCGNNQLTALDVSRLTALKSLSCYKNQLTSLDVSRLTALTSLSCGNNQLTALNVSNLTALTDLSCYNNQLTALDVSRLTALKSLSCYKNQLTSLDVSRLTALTSLSCYDNQLTALDVSRLTALTSLSCGNNQLTTLDVSNLTGLKSLSCGNNQLTTLDVSRLTALYTLSCYKNQLITLNVSNLTVLTELSCGNNQLTTLDVSRLTALKSLYCYNNQLAALDVARLTALEYLLCYNNQLTALDVSRLTALITLDCENNQLTSLEVSNLTALTYLECGGNQLTTLNVSKNTALKDLQCYRNQIKGSAMDALVNGLPQKSDGEYILYVIDNSENNEGNVCTKTHVKAAKAKGWIPYYDNGTKWIEYEGSDETPTTKGDVNGDNQVNGTDLVALTNIILGKNAQTTAADVNGDGYVNGTDYVALANIVLGRSNAKASAMAKGAVQAVATTGLTIESLDIKAGESKEMVIDLTNPNDDITLVQFDLRLPAGLSVKQTGGEYDIDMAGRTTWRKHSLDANATNGIVRFLLASSSNATLTGTEGAVIKITIAADNSFTDGDIQLENILLVTPAEKEIKQDVYTYHVGQSQPSPASTGLAIEPFSISAGGEAEMVIDMTNPDDEITLVQFDLRLPAGLSVKQTGGDYDYDIAGRTTWRKHSLDANATNGIVRFLLASSSNATLTGTEGAIIKIALKADNTFAGGAVKLENILLVTPAEKEIKQPGVNYTIGTTGIKGVASGNIEKDAPIYNLSGQRLDKPRKGINIINGKKVMVK